MTISTRSRPSIYEHEVSEHSGSGNGRTLVLGWAAAMGTKEHSHTVQPAVADGVLQALAIQDPAGRALAVRQLMETSAVRRKNELLRTLFQDMPSGS